MNCWPLDVYSLPRMHLDTMSREREQGDFLRICRLDHRVCSATCGDVVF